MPTLTLGGGTVAAGTTFPDPADINRRVAFGNGAIANTATGNSPAVSLRVFAPSIASAIASSLEGNLKRRVRLPGTMASSTAGAVKVFVNSTPVAAPVGELSVPSIESLLDPTKAAPKFNGSRIPQGVLFPVGFSFKGQQLEGLDAYLTVKRLGTTPPTLEFEKSSTGSPGGILLSDPAIDPANKVETCTGSLQISVSDTENLPDDKETELSYVFFVSDSLGRKHVIERGSFTVYPI